MLRVKISFIVFTGIENTLKLFNIIVLVPKGQVSLQYKVGATAELWPHFRKLNSAEHVPPS